MTTIDGALTPASISRASTDDRSGRFASIDAPPPSVPPQPESDHARERGIGAALLLGLGVVCAFVFAEIVAGGVLHALGVPIEVSGALSLGEVLALSAMKASSALAAVAVVLGGLSTWQRIGLGPDSGSPRDGWNALLPVGVLVIALPLGAAIANGDPLIDPNVDLGLGAALVVLAILVAITEELWFRGLLVNALETARRPWFTIAASAVLFGLPHLPGGPAALVNAIAVTLAVGVPFTVVRLRHGSLLPLIAWHAVIDIWAFLHTASVTPTGSPDASDIAAALVVPTLVAVGYLWWFRRTAPAAAASA